MRFSRYTFTRPTSIVFLIAVLLNLALWGFAISTFPKDHPAAVLHYSVGVGIDFIGSGEQLLTIPAIGTVLLLANALVARLLSSGGKQVFWIIWGSTPVIEIILLIAYISIWRLN